MTKRSSRFGMGFLGFLALALARQSAREGRRERVLRLIGRPRDGPFEGGAMGLEAGYPPGGAARPAGLGYQAPGYQGPSDQGPGDQAPSYQAPDYQAQEPQTLEPQVLGPYTPAFQALDPKTPPDLAQEQPTPPAPASAGATESLSEESQALGRVQAIQAGRSGRRASLAGGVAWWSQPGPQAPTPGVTGSARPAAWGAHPAPSPSPQASWPQAEAAAALMLDPPWLHPPAPLAPVRPGSLSLYPGEARSLARGETQAPREPERGASTTEPPSWAPPQIPAAPGRTTLAALELLRTQLAQILREDALRHGLDLKEG